METIRRRRGRPRKDATKATNAPAKKPVAKASDLQGDNIDIKEGKSGVLGASAAAMLRYSMSVFSRKPPICADEYIERRNEYFDACVSADALPSKPGLAIALGYNNTNHMGELIGQQERDSALVHLHEKTIGALEDATAALTTQGRIGAMFLLKASYGYRETSPQNALDLLPALSVNINFGALPGSVQSANPNSQALTIDIPMIPAS